MNLANLLNSLKSVNTRNSLQKALNNINISNKTNNKTREFMRLFPNHFASNNKARSRNRVNALLGVKKNKKTFKRPTQRGKTTCKKVPNWMKKPNIDPNNNLCKSFKHTQIRG